MNWINWKQQIEPNNKPMMQLLIVSDIFGQCAGLQQLLQDLSEPEQSITVLDPYGGQIQSFLHEQQAYAAYCEHCGHDLYTSLVNQALIDYAEPFDLVIGFSAGASALWRALADPATRKVKQAVLFYPGQIQPYLHLKPQVPVQLIFGSSAPHFDVAEICINLSQQSGVEAISTPWQHGFMNPVSAAYSEAGYQQHLRLIKDLVAE